MCCPEVSCPADTPRPTDEKANAGGGSVWLTSGQQHTETKIRKKNDLRSTGLSGKKSRTQGELPCRVLNKFGSTNSEFGSTKTTTSPGRSGVKMETLANEMQSAAASLNAGVASAHKALHAEQKKAADVIKAKKAEQETELRKARKDFEEKLKVQKEELAQEREVFERQMEEREAEFEERVAEWSRANDAIPKVIEQISSRIKLNIGGFKFETSKSTLELSPYFAAMLSGRFEIELDTEGYLFIDRDGESFKYLLSWLRGALSAPMIEGMEKTIKAAVMHEAIFFQVASIASILADPPVGAIFKYASDRDGKPFIPDGMYHNNYNHYPGYGQHGNVLTTSTVMAYDHNGPSWSFQAKTGGKLLESHSSPCTFSQYKRIS